MLSYWTYLLLIGLPLSQAQVTENGKTSLEIVSTAGCPDSQDFFLSGKLKDIYGNYSAFMDVDIKVVGRIAYDEDNNTFCDGGFLHYCEENYFQRCALDLLGSNTEAKINYMMCEFTTDGFNTSLDNWQVMRREKCINSVGLSLTAVTNCVNSTKGASLTEESIQVNNNIRKVLKWVPSVVFDGLIDEDLHWKAIEDVSLAVCEVFLKNGVDRCHMISNFANAVSPSSVLLFSFLAILSFNL